MAMLIQIPYPFPQNFDNNSETGRAHLGDILQVLTSRGVAYAQVTHNNPGFGFLIRVFNGFYSEQPKDFSVLVDCELQFSAFFVVKSAVNQGVLSVVANVPVPESLKVFPIFRSRNGGNGGQYGFGMGINQCDWRGVLAPKR